MKRLNKDGEYEFGIYEVYYDDNGKVVSYMVNSLTPVCDSEEGLLSEIELMKEVIELL